MDKIVLPEDIDQRRRHLVGAAAMTLAAAQLGVASVAHGQQGPASPAMPAAKAGTHTSFTTLKQVKAGVLDIGYAEAGPAKGPVALLLHGWPYDIHSYVDVAPLLAAAGYRVIVPYARGYGSTRFLSNDTMRNGQPSALAVDTIAMMDALKIDKATIGGFDWGARWWLASSRISAMWQKRRRNRRT